MPRQITQSEMESHNWQPIETADLRNPVLLRAPGVPPVVMRWSARRRLWVGSRYGVFGLTRVYWDCSVCSPTEWAPITESEFVAPAGPQEMVEHE